MIEWGWLAEGIQGKAFFTRTKPFPIQQPYPLSRAAHKLPLRPHSPYHNKPLDEEGTEAFSTPR